VLQYLRFHLHVPGIVELAGLQHGACGGCGIPAPFELHAIKEGAVAPMVGGIALVQGDIAGLEVDHFVWACADGLQIVGGVAGLGPCVRADQVLGEDLATRPAKGVIPEGRGLGEHHRHRMVVECVDVFDVAVAAAGHRTGGRVGGVFPGEDDVVSRERGAIVPDHLAFQAPGHRGAIPGEATVVDARDRLRQDRHQCPIPIERG
jgi:hypothetical protein